MVENYIDYNNKKNKMKLFTKEIDKKLFEQYPKGSDLENQMVVAKIFNPYGKGIWYLLNSDPNDPDYIWAIVDLFEVETGSISRNELETIKVPPFRLGLERDLSFTPINAAELYRGLTSGKYYAKGGKINTIKKGDEYKYFGRQYVESDVWNKIKNQVENYKFAGNFYIKGWRNDGYLYFTDEYDQNLLSGIKLKDGEKIFRYYTYNTAIGGMMPLIKINMDKMLAYPMESLEFGDESVSFVTKGLDIISLNIVEDAKYADGGELTVSPTEKANSLKGQQKLKF
jgi:hypothetical protein